MTTRHCELVTLPPLVTVPFVDWQKFSVIRALVVALFVTVNTLLAASEWC